MNEDVLRSQRQWNILLFSDIFDSLYNLYKIFNSLFFWQYFLSIQYISETALIAPFIEKVIISLCLESYNKYDNIFVLQRS